MKHLMIFAMFSMMISSVSFAEEVETECPYMAESDSRVNPKQDIRESIKPEDVSAGSAVKGI